jgi:hypothetical protein
MNVAVWRNISLTHAVCEAAPTLLSVHTGEVLSCSGLGEAAVASSTALLSTTETVNVELGGLTSFVARALHAHVSYISVSSMLAAFALPADTHLLDADVAVVRAGRLDFTENFRTACSTSVHCHFQYVHGHGVMFLRSCSAAAQEAARAWLRSALGVPVDAGHVHALCRIARRQREAIRACATHCCTGAGRTAHSATGGVWALSRHQVTEQQLKGFSAVLTSKDS